MARAVGQRDGATLSDAGAFLAELSAENSRLKLCVKGADYMELSIPLESLEQAARHFTGRRSFYDSGDHR
jgi:hypothetical protein